MKTKAYKQSKVMFFAVACAFALPLTACQSVRAPSMSSDPVKMSSDTLCYRHASSRDEALAKEIARRDLNCARILESDPLYQGQRY